MFNCSSDLKKKGGGGWRLYICCVRKFAHLQFKSFQLIFPESVEEFFPAQNLLFHSKLSECICTQVAVALHHAQSASSSTGHAGEALAPREEEHRHLVEGHIAPPRPLGLLKDGCCCKWKTCRFRTRPCIWAFFPHCNICYYMSLDGIRSHHLASGAVCKHYSAQQTVRGHQNQPSPIVHTIKRRCQQDSPSHPVKWNLNYQETTELCIVPCHATKTTQHRNFPLVANTVEEAGLPWYMLEASGWGGGWKCSSLRARIKMAHPASWQSPQMAQ